MTIGPTCRVEIPLQRRPQRERDEPVWCGQSFPGWEHLPHTWLRSPGNVHASCMGREAYAAQRRVAAEAAKRRAA